MDVGLQPGPVIIHRALGGCYTYTQMDLPFQRRRKTSTQVVKKTDFEDAESFQQWCQGRDQGLVWSEQLEVQLLQDVLKQKCKQQQKLKQKLQKMLGFSGVSILN